MSEIKNPLSDIISDEQYEQLMNEGLLDTIKIRNKIIKKQYIELRAGKHLSSEECIDKIQREDYKYLQFESIRKIVMKK